MRKKIITLGINLKDEYKKRLESVGELVIQESPESVEDFLKKTKDADVIFSNGDFLLDTLPKLKNVFVTYPKGLEINNRFNYFENCAIIKA